MKKLLFIILMMLPFIGIGQTTEDHLVYFIREMKSPRQKIIMVQFTNTQNQLKQNFPIFIPLHI